VAENTSKFFVVFFKDHAIIWPASGLLTGNSTAFILRVPGTLHGQWWSTHGIEIFVGVVALLGAFAMSYSLGVELLNFGALIAFMGVNAAALVRYYLREPRKRLFSNGLPPLFGVVICFILWLNLSTLAKVVGGLWLAAGVAFGAWKTRGFRGDLVSFEVPSDTES